jgi:glucosylceramidase
MELPGPAEADFVAHYLRPALVSAALRPAIFGWDLSWGPLDATGPLIADAGNALSGIAWHCYFGSPTMMSALHASDPVFNQVVDECTTPARTDFPLPEEMISALRNWGSAFAVWNLALNPDGGPVEAQNGCPGCSGIVTIDPKTGTASLSPEYYELGQVSKYVTPGAVRIGSDHFVSYRLTSRYQTTVTSGVDDVAFQNPDHTKVLVLYNNSATSTRVSVEWNKRYLTCRLPAHATTTLTWH